MGFNDTNGAIAPFVGATEDVVSLKNKLVTVSSTASNIFAGAGGGLNAYQSRDGNKFSSADFIRFLGLGAVAGFLGGFVYGKISSGINKETGFLKGAVLGARRTTTNAAIGSLGVMTNDIISTVEDNNYSNFSKLNYWGLKAANIGVSLGLGAFSSFAQINLARNANSTLWRGIRYGYLNVKSPIFGKILAGHITDYGKF